MDFCGNVFYRKTKKGYVKIGATGSLNHTACLFMVEYFGTFTLTVRQISMLHEIKA